MDSASPMPRRAPFYGLLIALLPACAAFGEFVLRWHPLAILAFLYLLGVATFYAVRELRAPRRRGAREGGASPPQAAALLLLALFMLGYFGLAPLLYGLGAGVWLPAARLPLDRDVLYYTLQFVVWAAVFTAALRIPGQRFEFNLRLRCSWWDAVILLGVGGATAAILSLYLVKLGGEHQPMHIFGADPATTPVWLYLSIGGIFTLANALAEELWCRSILLAALRPLLPMPAVIGISAVAFGLTHWFGTPQGIFGLVLAGLWAVALGWWTYARRSLWQALLVHLLADWLIFWFTNAPR